MNRMVIAATCLLGLGCCASLATTWGETYPIIETDLAERLRETIREAQASGQWNKELQKTKQRLEHHVQNPVDLQLPDTKELQVHEILLIDEKTWQQLDSSWQNRIDLTHRLYAFFHADHSEHLSALRVLMASKSLRPVAVGGNLLTAQNELSSRIWADQGGVLTNRFSLQSVPAVVEISGRKARIVSFPAEFPQEALQRLRKEEP